MKKIIAIMLAIFMMAAIAVPAFADGGNVFVDDNAAVGGTLLVYGTSQSYTVTIPAQINLTAGQTSTAEDVTISDYKLAAGNRVSLSINSANEAFYTTDDDESWFLVEATIAEGVVTPVAVENKKATDVPYIVYGDGVELARNAVIVYADSSTAVNPTAKVAKLTVYTEGTSQAANFTDTISFTASVGAIPTPPPAEG